MNTRKGPGLMIQWNGCQGRRRWHLLIREIAVSVVEGTDISGGPLALQRVACLCASPTKRVQLLQWARDMRPAVDGSPHPSGVNLATIACNFTCLS